MFFMTSKNLMRLNAVFWKVYSRRMFFLFTWNIRNIFLIFTWYERATVGNSLHVRNNFWCVTMTSAKLMQHVYVASLKSKEKKYVLQGISIIVIIIFCMNSLTKCLQLALIYYQVSASLVLKVLFLSKKFIAKLINYKSF